jgi:hypothetical protein
MGIIINNPVSNTVADGAVTTAKIADGAVTPSKLSVAIQSSSPNYFKNPAFSVVQGTASGTLTNSLALPTASLGYPGESEWCIAASGGTPAYAFNTPNQTLTLTGAASTTAIHVLQRIESIDANRLASKQVTLSVEMSNSLLTSVTWELFRPTTTANTHGTIASPTQTLIASGTWTVNSTLTRYSTTLTLPAEVSNGLEVRFRVAAQTSGTWVISRPKLEEGGSFTAFISEDYSIELAKCQRYYEIMRFATGVLIGVGTTATTFSPPQANGVYLGWKTTKMSTPVASSSASSTFVVASVTGTGSVALATDTNGVALTISASSGSTVSSWTCVPVNASTNSFVAGASHIP